MPIKINLQMKKLFLLLALFSTFMASMQAQGRRGALYINEVMVQNDSNLVDDFGQRSGWIELYNAKFAPLEISTIYITDDRNNPTKYSVPLGDVNTRIPKRQHVVFFTDGTPSRGTFHTSLVLDPSRENWIGLYDSDKHTLIDSVLVPVLPANASYARTTDGTGRWQVRTDEGELYITPSSSNVIRDKNDKIEQFAEKDENGFAMTLMAMCIVFSALLVLCLCFKAISSIGAGRHARNKMKAAGVEKPVVTTKERHEVIDSGEEIAAIVMALHEHLNAHDQESHILTINKVKRAYSPWSSKIYNMRHLPHR